MEPTATQTEKTMACAMHLGSIPAPIVAPICGLLVGVKSKYVRAHALQSLYETILLNALLTCAMIVSITYTLYKVWLLYENDWQGWNWQEFFLRFLVGWIVLGLLWVWSTVSALHQARKAYLGHWPKQARIVRKLAQPT